MPVGNTIFDRISSGVDKMTGSTEEGHEFLSIKQKEKEIEIEDLRLIDQLFSIGAQNSLAAIVPKERHQLLRNVSSFVVSGNIPEYPNYLDIQFPILESQSPLIIDDLIEKSEEMIRNGDPGAALSNIIGGIRKLIRSLFNHNLDISCVYRQIDKIRDTISNIAGRLGANEFTISFNAGVPIGITVGLHFKAGETHIDLGPQEIKT